MNSVEIRPDNEISIKESLLRLLFSALLIGGNIYAGEVRDNSSARIALFIISLFAVAGIAMLIIMYATRGIIPRRKDIINLILSLGFLSVYLYVPTYFISQVFLINSSLSEFSIPSSTQSAAFISVLVLLAGSILFFIRLKFRFVYGATEVIVGVYFAFHKIYEAPKPISILEITEPIALVILTGAIYLVVRGLDNMHQGMTKENDPVGVHVFKWVESVTRQSEDSEKSDYR